MVSVITSSRPIYKHFMRILRRSTSTTAQDDLVHILIDDSVATLTMNRKPVNSLSLEMCESISSAIKRLEKDPNVQSLVLASSNASIFSAGLDLKEMYNPEPIRLDRFWNSFQQLYIDLYGTRLATVAAIEGHAPAAGCMLALSCDYRVMSSDDSFSIGLNESRFGIVAPPWLCKLMIRTIGFRQGEMALALGTLFNPLEALNIGLVDLVVDRELVIESSHETAKRWARIPPHARIATKKLARDEHISNLLEKRNDDLEYFTSFVLNSDVQKNLGRYLESLSKKRTLPNKST